MAGKADSCPPDDRVATYIIETLDYLSLLARDTGQADMASVLKHAFDQCLLGHINAKAEQLSAQIGAGQTGEGPLPL